MRGLIALMPFMFLAVPALARTQATRVSAPEGDYLLRISQRWGAESVLGDLQHRPAESDFLEVRAWV